MELVAGASTAALNSVLSNLGSFVAREYALIRRVRGDIQYINEELASMRAFLGHLNTGADYHDEQTRDWMKQVRDVADDIEDCIFDFDQRLRDEPRDVGCVFAIRIRLFELFTWCPRSEIAAKVAELKNRAQHVGERRIRYDVEKPNLNGGGVRRISWVGGVLGGFEAARIQRQFRRRQLVGTKDPVVMEVVMEDLSKWVTNERNKVLSVLSITGISGVGKTTIATALFRKFRGQFDKAATVTVSQNSDHETILRGILDQVARPGDDENGSTSVTATSSRSGRSLRRGRRQGMGSMNMDQLAHELGKHLEQSRYMLLIDDVWSSSIWEEIGKWLPENGKGSRVIVTTRFSDVTTTPRGAKLSVRHHIVGTLGYLESEKLFAESVNQSRGTNDPPNSHEFPKYMWELSGGLPLVIVTMAGSLPCNPGEPMNRGTELFKTLRQGSVSFRTQEGFGRILNICFCDFPAELKTCLAYLSIFPKGYRVNRKHLTRRWVVEGFVSEMDGLSAAEVAEAYFDELIRRNITLPVEFSRTGKVKTCQVHDMVLDYIISSSSKDNFITVIGSDWSAPVAGKKVRRLSLHCTGLVNSEATMQSLDLTRVRAVTLFGSLDKLHFQSFKSGIVQVLDLEGCKGLKENHIRDICEMLLLKYLSLRRTDVKKLSSRIGNLKYLETLDIRETDVAVLPDTVGQLRQMRNILCGNKTTRKALRLPEGMKKKAMRTLLTLSGIEISRASTSTADLHELTELRKLAIYKLRLHESEASFKKLLSSIQFLGNCSLHSLAIDDELSYFINSLDSMFSPPRYLNALELHGMLEKVPRWIAHLGDLRKLTLSATTLRTDTFQLLSHLPSLFSLTFSFGAGKHVSDLVSILHQNTSDSEGHILVRGGGFVSLKLLRFRTPLMPPLTFSDKAMPELEFLELHFMTLERMVSGMNRLSSLQEAHLICNFHKAGGITKEILRDLKTSPRKYANASTRIIVDE